MNIRHELGLTQNVTMVPVRTTLVDHWPKWVVASVLKHFNDRRRHVPMFAEGQEQLDRLPEWFEVRVDGPYIKKYTKPFYEIGVEVNVLISTAMNNSNLYTHQNNVGTIVSAFDVSIPLLKLGLGIDDTGEQWGCLTLSNAERDALRVTNFGQITSHTPMLRSSVEGHYYAQVKNNGSN